LGFVVAVSGSGLAASSPAGPVPDGVDLGWLVADEVGEKPADLGGGERDLNLPHNRGDMDYEE